MLRKLPPSGVLFIFFLITGLISCNGDFRDNGGNKGGISFDTTRASRSVIPIREAITLQQSFITTRTELGRLITDTFLTRNFNLPNSETFTKDALLLLLSQKGADGIRFYYGKDNKGVVRLVLLPVTKDGKDIYTRLITSSRSQAITDSIAKKSAARASAADSDAEAVETGQTCPTCTIDPQQQ